MDSRRLSGFARAIGVERAHRSVVAGVHGLKQVEGFRSADFADDDSFRTHTQAVLDEITHGDFAFAFEVGRARFKAHNVGLLELKLGRVFAGDDALVVIDAAGQAVEKRRLAGTRAARDQDVAANAPDDFQDDLWRSA